MIKAKRRLLDLPSLVVVAQSSFGIFLIHLGTRDILPFDALLCIKLVPSFLPRLGIC